jgi:zinc D-Ala-D-Ala carboxypeptidase
MNSHVDRCDSPAAGHPGLARSTPAVPPGCERSAAGDAALPACWAELGITPALLAGRCLPRHAEPPERIVVAGGVPGRVFELAPAAAEGWADLRAAARADGIELLLISAFRSVDRQAEIVRARLAAGHGIAAVMQAVAPPGCSEHHSGCAIDLATVDDPELEERFEASPAFAWLQREAGRFGFRMSYPRGNPEGFVYEPWHWCWHAQADSQPG